MTEPICPPGGEQLNNRRRFQDAIELFDPPKNLYEISAGLIRWNWTEREKVLKLKNDSPALLKASLRHWILAAMAQSPTQDPSSMSTRRLSHIIYGLRGIKIQEFVELMKAPDFAGAIFELTGINVGYRRQEEVLGKEGNPVSERETAGPGAASRSCPSPGGVTGPGPTPDTIVDMDKPYDLERVWAGNTKYNICPRNIYH